MKNYKIFILSLFLAFAVFACNENQYLGPYNDDSDKTPPSKLEVTKVRPIAGGAVISYNVPKDPDMMYVKAEFLSTKGLPREARSSFYVDSIRVEGLGNEEPVIVKLYSVDRNENISEPVAQQITPGKPAIDKVLESLQQKEDWGGFLLNYNNEDKAEIGIYVTYTNEENLIPVAPSIFFTSLPKGLIAVRGLKSLLSDFSVYVKDKWGNSSDTLKFSLKPWKEDKLDKKLFRPLYKVPHDVDWNNYAGNFANLYDEVIGAWNFGHTAYPIEFPHAFSIDLGVNVRLSRYRLYQWLGSDADYYAHGVPRYFKIYGCPEDKDPYKSENWVVIMQSEVKKPSGGEFGSPLTADDREEALRGHEFTFMDVPVIRYFRFESLASWSGMQCSRISEISLWGDISEE